ncbi:MAG: DUF4136 domain-containing protein [Archangium sp.]
MSLRWSLAGALLVLGLVSCTSIKTSTNYDPNAVQEVASYRTYAWLPMKEGGDPRIHNPIIQARVQQAVDRDLQGRGYKRVDPGQNPDFEMGWHGAVDKKVEADVINSYYGYAWDPWYDPFYGPVAYGGAGVPQTVVREYTQGTLILDVVDAKSDKLVWRGTAQAELSEHSDAKKSQKLINSAVEKMLAKFPPQEK